MTLTGRQDGDSSNDYVTLDHTGSGGDYDDQAKRLVVFTDDDEGGAILVSLSSLTLTEGGGTGTFTVTLESRPNVNVRLSITSGDTGALTVNPAALTFDVSNYSTAQTATVTDDDPGLTASAITATTATLTLANHTVVPQADGPGHRHLLLRGEYDDGEPDGPDRRHDLHLEGVQQQRLYDRARPHRRIAHPLAVVPRRCHGGHESV